MITRLNNLDGPEAVILTCLIIIFIVAFFLLIREIYCWYWKINERTEYLNRIDKNLQYLVDLIKERQESEKNSQ